MKLIGNIVMMLIGLAGPYLTYLVVRLGFIEGRLNWVELLTLSILALMGWGVLVTAIKGKFTI